jgi:hypothetical protein
MTGIKLLRWNMAVLEKLGVNMQQAFDRGAGPSNRFQRLLTGLLPDGNRE